MNKTMPQAIRGVDLSHHNGPGIDFHTMQAAGIRFVGLKATEGATYLDPTFTDRRVRARATGFDRLLLYHFFQPLADPKDQAALFSRIVGRLAPSEIPVIDVEGIENGPGWGRVKPAAGVDAIMAFVYHVKLALGIDAKDVMLYGSPGWLRDQFGGELKDLAFMPLWAARYGPELGDVAPWDHATVWQNSDRGTVAGAGAPGTVDTDLLVGDWPTRGSS